MRKRTRDGFAECFYFGSLIKLHARCWLGLQSPETYPGAEEPNSKLTQKVVGKKSHLLATWTSPIRLYITWQLASLRHMIKEQLRVTPHCLLWSSFWVTSAVFVITESVSQAYSQQEEITQSMNNRRQGSLGSILKAGYFNCNKNFQFIWGNWLILMLIC